MITKNYYVNNFNIDNTMMIVWLINNWEKLLLHLIFRFTGVLDCSDYDSSTPDADANCPRHSGVKVKSRSRSRSRSRYSSTSSDEEYRPKARKKRAKVSQGRAKVTQGRNKVSIKVEKRSKRPARRLSSSSSDDSPSDFAETSQVLSSHTIYAPTAT